MEHRDELFNESANVGPLKKDITISIKNLPPAAYDTMADYVQVYGANIMRKMSEIQHLLATDSTVEVTYQPSQKTNVKA